MRTRVVCKGKRADTKAQYNTFLINTERQATLQKRRYTKKKLKINNYELLNISNMNLVKT